MAQGQLRLDGNDRDEKDILFYHSLSICLVKLNLLLVKVVNFCWVPVYMGIMDQVYCLNFSSKRLCIAKSGQCPFIAILVGIRPQ